MTRFSWHDWVWKMLVERGDWTHTASPVRALERRFFIAALLIGFGVVLAAMVGSGVMGLQAIRQVDREMSSLTAEQLRDTKLIDELAHYQASLGVLLYSLADQHQPESFAALAGEFRGARERVHQIVAQALAGQRNPEKSAAWRVFEKTSSLVLDEAERLLKMKRNTSPVLSKHYRNLTAASDRLMAVSLDEASRSRGAQLVFDAGLLRAARNLFLASLGLAVIFAGLSVAASMNAFLRLEKQAKDMERLSIHILTEQEESARRFSQDMHDEFGQTLNAVESNLSVVRGAEESDRERLRDAVNMVREAQSTAREMSQLLRPRILDDFGLDAGLRELARGFSQRTGIVVDYRSQVRERLEPLVETHLFRICQEALTNVSRHSSASKVDIAFRRARGRLNLSVVDNGGGMAVGPALRNGLGILGMKERAQVIGGVLSVQSLAGAGVTILVDVPDAPGAAA